MSCCAAVLLYCYGTAATVLLLLCCCCSAAVNQSVRVGHKRIEHFHGWVEVKLYLLMTSYVCVLACVFWKKYICASASQLALKIDSNSSKLVYITNSYKYLIVKESFNLFSKKIRFLKITSCVSFSFLGLNISKWFNSRKKKTVIKRSSASFQWSLLISFANLIFSRFSLV